MAFQMLVYLLFFVMMMTLQSRNTAYDVSPLGAYDCWLMSPRNGTC